MDRDPLVSHWIELLVHWWRYEQQYQPVRGYPSVCPSARDWRCSRQHDGENGAAETDALGSRARQVGYIVASLAPIHRAALYELARNRATGVAVFRNPRLPEDRDERARITAEALELFGVLAP